MTRCAIDVLVPLPTRPFLTYLAETPDATVGAWVRVPVGRRSVDGVVWGRHEDVAASLAPKLRCINTLHRVPGLRDAHRSFMATMAEYTLTSLASLLKMVAGVDLAEVERALKPPQIWRLSATPPGSVNITPRQQKVLDCLIQSDAVEATPTALAKAAGVSVSVVQRLRIHGVIETVEAPELPEPRGATKRPTSPAALVLQGEQKAAAETLIQTTVGQGFRVTVVQGVTGSGKTEVYFAAMAAVLARGDQVLVLMPEIMLSEQWVERFTHYFGHEVGVWHSGLTPAQRTRLWAQCATGQVGVVVGARSAVMLPFDRLGLVVVDEEHDPSYKQEDGVLYHARDMAILRAHHHKVGVVLVSATPSCETFANIEQGRYQSVMLPQRFGAHNLPTLRFIDLRVHPPERGAWLSPPLLEGVAETLAEGGQAFVFINRRGYAPLRLCRSCGHRVECPNCAVSLVQHQSDAVLLCHYCGHTEPAVSTCPACHTDGAMVAHGPGAERVFEELQHAFPNETPLLVTSDTMTSVTRARAALERLRSGEARIIVGTQILAKGHDFKNMRCVAVVSADQSLSGVDLRASERTFQMLEQVTGRSGRHGPGIALIQTYLPEHPLLQALQAGNRTDFWHQELANRRALHMPPFTRLLAVIVASPDAHRAERCARAMVALAPTAEQVHVLGPVPAPLSKLRGSYRWRILVRSPRHPPLQPWARAWQRVCEERLPEYRRVRVQWDVDPMTFL